MEDNTTFSSNVKTFDRVKPCGGRQSIYSAMRKRGVKKDCGEGNQFVSRKLESNGVVADALLLCWMS